MQKTLRDGLVLQSLSERQEREQFARFYADVYTMDGKAEALFDILFPRKRSALFPVS